MLFVYRWLTDLVYQRPPGVSTVVARSWLTQLDSCLRLEIHTVHIMIFGHLYYGLARPKIPQNSSVTATDKTDRNRWKQNDGNNPVSVLAVRGHPTSSNLMPIGSVYATSYRPLIHVSPKKHAPTFSTITLTISVRLQFNFWHSQ